MQLPKQITPNPLVLSTVELRFSSNLNESSILSTIFPLFSKELPFLSEGKIPKDLKRQNEQFRYAPDFCLKNELYTLSFSNNVISFENNKEYTLWDNYFGFIKTQLLKLIGLGIIDNFDRVGVRYVSIFENKKDIQNVLKKTPSMTIDGYNENFLHYSSEIKKEKINLHLNIAKNAKVERDGVTKIGTLIYIDASFNEKSMVNESVFETIDSLHLEQKKLFFSLLCQDFIKELNPSY